MSNTICEGCGRQHREGGECPDCAAESIAGRAGALIQAIEFGSPAELREAARSLDDLGNDPATSAKLRPMYRALSDVIKSWR